MLRKCFGITSISTRSNIHSLFALYISFGVICGIGSGVAYNTVMATVSKRFPDKPGLISIFNGVGRVIFGGMFDKLGRSTIMQVVNVVFIVSGVVLMLALKSGSFVAIVAGFIIGGLAYGGVTPTNSAFISSYFGMKNYPMNFPVINTNLIIASFGSTLAGALYDASQSYMSTYIMICILAIAGIAVSFGINLCDKRTLLRMNTK